MRGEGIVAYSHSSHKREVGGPAPPAFGEARWCFAPKSTRTHDSVRRCPAWSLGEIRRGSCIWGRRQVYTRGVYWLRDYREGSLAVAALVVYDFYAENSYTREAMMATPRLQRGRVYRTEDLSRFDKNPTRLASKLVRAGKLRRLRKGLYHAPRQSAFGEVPPSEGELLRAYFRGRPYLRTGPSVWNALGLGTTAVETVPLVYNTTHTGEVEVGGRRFELRRVRFPQEPDPEYFVVDLLENPRRAGVELERVRRALTVALGAGRFDSEQLLDRASEYGTRATSEIVREAVTGVEPAPA